MKWCQTDCHSFIFFAKGEKKNSDLVNTGNWGFSCYPSRYGYLFGFKRNVENLNREVKRLWRMRNGVCGQVDATCWNGELIDDVVKGQLASVEGVEADAKRLDNQISRRSRCSDLRLCYDPGKEAEKKTGVVDALQRDRSRMLSGMKASIWLWYYGMGGIGKTALMKEVVKRLKTDELFNKVVVVILS